MAERKAFLLRVDPALLDSLQRWAADDLRSLNGQIEFVLRRAVQREGRTPGGSNATRVDEGSGAPGIGARPARPEPGDADAKMPPRQATEPRGESDAGKESGA